MPRFTDRYVNGLKRKSRRYEKWEGAGFGVRVTPRGMKSFIWVYHFDGKSRRLTLGRYPHLSLGQARIDLAAAQKQLEDGVDPGAVKVAEHKAEQQAETVKELGKKYIALYAKQKKRTWKEDQRILEKDIYPRWGKKKARNVTRADVISLLDNIAVRGPIMANRTRSLLSKMFRWAIPRGHVDKNPVEFVERPGKESMRERMLEIREIPQFWNGLQRADMSQGVRLGLRLALVTVQRRGEIAGMSPSEIDDATGVWVIPGARTKNSRPHKVPLSPLALEIIREARKLAAKFYDCEPEDVPYLFPTYKRNGKPGPINPSAFTRALAEAEDEVGKRISPHDLRRTASTVMGSEELSISRFVRDRILNHSDRSPGAHYDINEYLPEKREALNAWGSYLSKLLKKRRGKVVELGARRNG